MSTPRPAASAAFVQDLRKQAVSSLAPVAGPLQRIGERFREAGYAIALVGGPVRDALLGRLTPDTDLDFATDAHPEQVLALLEGWAEAVWDVGIRFGTVGARVDGREVEITTYRTEAYETDSRKPDVVYGTQLSEDLSRRDFTINAMAMTLPDLTFVDEYDGLADLAARRIRTPVTAQQSFDDDPLRMMRAARFAAQLDFTVDDDVIAAMTEQAARIEIVSA
ncbi:MAG TPA: CCA tRNA nucleotidyltransferase, partial [Candidatus Nanopelagicales bacterium]|nr:CCA tRNA nucleotidyltransferase [Candidatus Nanopelagicales bacterium]